MNSSIKNNLIKVKILIISALYLGVLLSAGNYSGTAAAAGVKSPMADDDSAWQVGVSDATEDVTEVAVGAEFNGYLFCLKDETELSSGQAAQLNEQLAKDADQLTGLRSFAADNAGKFITQVARQADTNLYLADSLTTIERLFNDGQLAYVEPNYKVELAAEPDDPYYALYQWYLPLINAEYSWTKGVYGNNIRIAVIDSGVISEHEDLDNSRILSGQNYLANPTAANYKQQLTDTSDATGHGTFICGLIGSVLNNKLGIAGLSSAAELVSLKCFTSGTNTFVSDLLQAIYDAVDVYNCDVINMSWVLKADNSSLKTALKYAADQGAILVAAAGNDGATNNSLRYPAAYDFVIGVGSLNSNLSKSGFSPSNSSIFVTAPGSSLYSLQYTSATGYSSGSGTSYSTPLVAALAALLRGLDHDLTMAEYMQLLAETAAYLGDEAAASYDNAYTAAYNTSYGFGVINVATALQRVLNKVAVTEARLVNGTVNLVLDGAIEKEAHCFVAAYDQENRLIALKMISTEDIAREIDATLSFDNTDAESVKTFVTDADLKPLQAAGYKRID